MIMKLFYAFLTLILCVCSTTIYAQGIAEGGCSSVTVTSAPSYSPNIFFTSVGWKQCRGTGSSSCCRVITSGNPAGPRYFLEIFSHTSSTWSQVGNVQFSPTFNNVNTNGTYRVRVNVPVVAYNICEGGQPIDLYSISGQWIGWWGTWGGDQYTNEVIVGTPGPADIDYSFIDPGETGSETAYDYGETVIMDATASKNYNEFVLNIYEDGPTFDRSRSSNGWTWTHGIAGTQDLSFIWKGGAQNWQFEEFHSYEVQFVTNNIDCHTGWNKLHRTFFICPAGSGCRLDLEQDPITISPNPASTHVVLQNLDFDVAANYQLQIVDLSGKLVKTNQMIDNEIDISDLENGMFILNVLENGKPMFTSKLAISH